MHNNQENECQENKILSDNREPCENPKLKEADEKTTAGAGELLNAQGTEEDQMPAEKHALEKEQESQELKNEEKNSSNEKENDAKLKKAKAGAISSFLIMVLCVSVWLFNSFSAAWFAANKQVSGNGMNMTIASPLAVKAEVTVFEVLGKIENQLYFDPTPIFDSYDPDTASNSVTLPQYDPLNTINRYLLVKIEIESKEDQALDLTVNTDTDYFMDSDHQLLGGDGKNDSYQNCLSSIVCFATPEKANVKENDTVSLEPSQSANGDAHTNAMAHSLSLDGLTTKKFANNDGDMAITNNTISLRDSITSNEDHTVVYILVTYDVDNINLIYSLNIGSEVLSSGSGIVFIGDIHFAIVPKETT